MLFRAAEAGTTNSMVQDRISLGRLISASKLPASESSERRLVLDASSSTSPPRGSGCKQNPRKYDEEAGRRLPDKKKADGHAQHNQRGRKSISRRAFGSGINLAGLDASVSLFRVSSQFGHESQPRPCD